MKFYRNIYINERGFPPDLYAEIVRLKPECRRDDVFMLEALAGDEVNGQLAERIAALCEKRGLRRTAGDVGTYGYMAARKYETDDLLAAPFFLLKAQQKQFKDFADRKKRDETGRLVIPATQATSSVKLGSVSPTKWIVVSDPVRRQFESDGLIGLDFSEVALKGKSSKTPPYSFWELKSSHILPKMVNSTIYPDRGFFGISDFYMNGEPHYRQSDLKPFGQFDIAYTFESRELSVPEHCLIVSQKFYQCCRHHHIPLEVVPVRIDPE